MIPPLVDLRVKAPVVADELPMVNAPTEFRAIVPERSTFKLEVVSLTVTVPPAVDPFESIQIPTPPLASSLIAPKMLELAKLPFSPVWPDWEKGTGEVVHWSSKVSWPEEFKDIFPLEAKLAVPEPAERLKEPVEAVSEPVPVCSLKFEFKLLVSRVRVPADRRDRVPLEEALEVDSVIPPLAAEIEIEFEVSVVEVSAIVP